MEDLHRGALVKVYVTVVRADDRWSAAEKRVAATLVEHLWGHPVAGAELREAATEMFRQADRLPWPALVGPFVRYPPLSDGKAQLETVVMRLANLIAKCDGSMAAEESEALHTIQRELDEALYPSREKAAAAAAAGAGGTSSANADAGARDVGTSAPADGSDSGDNMASREERLRGATAELDALIGLDAVKERVLLKRWRTRDAMADPGDGDEMEQMIRQSRTPSRVNTRRVRRLFADRLGPFDAANDYRLPGKLGTDC